MRRCIPELRYILPLLFCAAWLGALRGQGFPNTAGLELKQSSPVEELRQALRTPFPPSLNEDELKYQLEFRRGLLEKRVKALGVGDLRRALLLQEWRDTDRDLAIRDLDRAVRDQVVERLRQTLQQLLKSPEPTARRAALTQIAELGIAVRGGGDAPLARGLAPDLLPLFSDSDPVIRAAAVRALGRIDPEQELVFKAGALLNDQSLAVRQATAEALVELVRTIEPLMKSRGTTGIEITRAQAALTARAAALTARPGIDQPHPEVSRPSLEAVYRAAVVLRDLVLDPTRQDFPPPDRKPTEDERAEMERYRRVVEEERADVMPLARGLDELIPHVARSLSRPDGEVRLRAAQTLEEIGIARLRLLNKAQSVPRLPPEKKDDKKEGAAARPADCFFVLHLADVLDDDPLRASLLAALPQIEARLRDPDVQVRRIAVNVLETLSRDKEIAAALPAITRAMADSDLFVRWSAARLVGRIGPIHTEATVPALARLLTDGDLDVQMAAATALGRLGGKAAAAVPTLSQQVPRGDPENRVEMIEALQAIGQPADPAVRALGAALADADPRVRIAAANALRSFGPPAKSATPQLVNALNDSNEDVRKGVSDALLAVTVK